MIKEYYFLTLAPIDYTLSGIVIILLMIYGMIVQSQKKDSLIYYSFYAKGLFVKILGGVIFSLIYLYYYKGGDTIDYYSGAICMKNLFYYNPTRYFELMFFKMTPEKYFSYFNNITYWPPYHLINKTENFNVIRISSVLAILTGGNFLTSTVLFAFTSYLAVWQLYKLFVSIFPVLYKQFAWGLFFTPSYFFWGSGILKDTVAVFCICMIIVYAYKIFQLKRIKLFTITWLILLSLLLLRIKPYLLLALIPGLIIWFTFDWVKSIRIWIFRVLALPVAIVSVGIIMGLVYLKSSSGLGNYSAEMALKHASVIQQDLVRVEAYGSNRFDIGTFEPTLSGVLKKAPAAINAGLFRPYIWESKSFVMLFSGLENLFLLLFTIYSFIKLRFRLFTEPFNNPILSFCFIFSILIAFIVGLTTANFGALVRYRMQILPFFIIFFIILNHIVIQKNAADYKPQYFH